MGNTRHRPAGTVPAAFSANGQEIPPSPDVAEHNLAQVIGQAVALHLGQLLAGLQRRPACIVCAARAKRAVRAHEVALANAKAAAEPLPPEPDAGITESFTDGARGPVCWGCYDPDIDGPFDLAGLLPPPED